MVCASRTRRIQPGYVPGRIRTDLGRITVKAPGSSAPCVWRTETRILPLTSDGRPARRDRITPVGDRVAGGPQCRDDCGVHVLVRHQFLDLGSSSDIICVDAVPVQHIGGKLQGRADVLRMQPWVCLEDLRLGLSGRQSLQDRLDRYPGPRDHGLAHHHFGVAGDSVAAHRLHLALRIERGMLAQSPRADGVLAPKLGLR